MFKNRREKKDERLRQEFLPEALEIIEKPASTIGHTVIWLIILVIIAFLIWSIVGRIDETATASGKVVTEMGEQIIQSEVKGKVISIDVMEGDKVTKGQRIIAIDSTEYNTSLGYYQSIVNRSNLKIKLYQMIIDGGNPTVKDLNDSEAENLTVLSYAQSIKEQWDFDLDEKESEYESACLTMDTEEKNLNVLKSNLTNLLKKKELLKDSRESGSVEEEKLKQFKESLKILKGEVKQYRELYESDVITKVELEEKKKELKEAEANIKIQSKAVQEEKDGEINKLGDIEAQIAEVNEQIKAEEALVSEKKESAQRIKDSKGGIDKKYKNQLQSLILEQQDVAEQAQVQLMQINKNINASVITAPCDGIVQAMSINTMGAIVAEGSELVKIVPSNTDLIIEAMVSNSDIGYIKIGQKVSTKIKTYDFQKFGLLEGEVTYISKDSEVIEGLGTVYKIKVKTDINKFLDKNPTASIKTGMEGSVEIKTGNRRIIEFFLEPLMKRLDESLKVR